MKNARQARLGDAVADCGSLSADFFFPGRPWLRLKQNIRPLESISYEMEFS
jgi:hypothetical protein